MRCASMSVKARCQRGHLLDIGAGRGGGQRAVRPVQTAIRSACIGPVAECLGSGPAPQEIPSHTGPAITIVGFARFNGFEAP